MVGLEKERNAELFIEAKFLQGQVSNAGWQYEKQYTIPGTNKRIDYLVTTDELRFGIECKAKLTPSSEGMKAAALVSHFEQAAAYANALGMPVFLGPVVFPDSPSAAVQGGLQLSSLAALNLFGGRINVGTLLYHDYYRPFWTLSLRGQSFWKQGSGFSTTVNKFVTSTGSKKERRDLCQNQ